MWIFAIVPLAGAQVIPPAAEPGRQQRQLETLEMPERVPAIIVEEAVAEPPAGSESTRFVLTEIEFVGAEFYPEERLAEFGQELVDHEISLADLYRIAAQITRLYRSDGYILSKAVVPAQQVENGHVKIEIIEGFISKVSVECDDFRLVYLLEAHAREIEWAKPITADVLERHLLFIRDLPGVSARAVLRPSEHTRGASDLILQVDTNPFTVFAQATNRGSRISGPYRGDFGVTLNSIFGLHEEISGRVITTFNDELLLLQSSIRQVVNRYGTSVGATFTYADTQAGGNLEVLGLQGESISWSVSLDQPIIRSRRQNLSVNASFDWLDSESDIAGFPNTEDRIRSFRVGGAYDWVDGFRGVNQLTTTISQGVNLFGADDERRSRPEGELDYTKIEARVARLQNLYRALNMLIEVQGQYAFSPLLATEEFGFGGQSIGRGFDESELAGDHGVAGLLEFQYGIPFGMRLLESAQVYAAYDYGIVFQDDDSDRLGTTVGKSEHAGSASAGIRFNFIPQFSGEFQTAIPVGRDAGVGTNDPSRDPRFFFSLTARY